MANPIHAGLAIGTIGELLVQTRLLQYDVQAAPPLKDSGNDLIALRGYEVRTIQVKTSSAGLPQIRNLPDRYHLLALVRLDGYGYELLLDKSEIFLVPREEVAGVYRDGGKLDGFRLTREHVDRLFEPRK